MKRSVGKRPAACKKKTDGASRAEGVTKGLGNEVRSHLGGHCVKAGASSRSRRKHMHMPEAGEQKGLPETKASRLSVHWEWKKRM